MAGKEAQEVCFWLKSRFVLGPFLLVFVVIFLLGTPVKLWSGFEDKKNRCRKRKAQSNIEATNQRTPVNKTLHWGGMAKKLFKDEHPPNGHKSSPDVSLG